MCEDWWILRRGERRLKQPAVSQLAAGFLRALREPGCVLSVCSTHILLRGFPDGSLSKEPAYNAGDMGSVPDSEKPLEGEMATHSSIPAWRIPWMEESGRLQSMGSQRIGHDSATKHDTSH